MNFVDKKELKQGNMTITMLYVIVVTFFMMGFVIEVGRLLYFNSTAQYAATAAAHAAAYSYQKTIQKELKDLSKDGRDLKIDQITDDEAKGIKGDAIRAAMSSAHTVAADNNADFITATPSNDDLSWYVEVRKHYQPFFTGVMKKSIDINRHATFYY
jgi:Flp pilus assembly protein TadG